MCGIVGILDPGGGAQPHLSICTRMVDSLTHRGPDDCGLWHDEARGMILGHRRLSILDLSAAGRQPMVSACGRFVIVLNGEIYNHLELRKATGRGSWRGHSDTESFLAGVAAWGLAETLGRSVGMFALALWDCRAGALYLARDRMGEKPLYYGWQGGVFLFGSELKALRCHPLFEGRIDRHVLALYLRHNCVPAPYTIYQGIRKLPPGTFLRVRDRGADPGPEPYWSLIETARQGIATPFTGSEAEAEALLDRCLRRAVAGQMVSDVPLGAFLSGGIDSSTIVALMQAQSSRPVKTFSVKLVEAAYDESHQARAVARHLGTDHTELCVTARQALEVVPSLPQIYDEPFADSSQIPTFLVARLARQAVTVSLSGDGGDELFGGYNRHAWAGALWRRFRCIRPSGRRWMARALLRWPPSRWDALFALLGGVLPPRWRHRTPGDKLHKLARVLPAATPRDVYLSLVSHWQDPASLVPGALEPATRLAGRDRLDFLGSFENAMMYLDQSGYLPDDILVKVDRAAMAVSLETRVPFLDHRVVALAWSFPLGLKVRDGVGKWILRRVLNRYVPRHLVERPKMGFAIPIDAWLRGPLRDWAESLLAQGRLTREGYFDPAPVRLKWAEHLSGRRNWAQELWDVLMFQAWREGNP